MYGSAGSLVSKTLTRTCDAVISLPVLKDHGITGVTLALKNFFGAIHNPNKYHTNAGDPYIADIHMFEPIRRKLRLTIADAITAQYEGGPSYMPQWSWPFNGLLVSQDPVAMDYTGWRLIDAGKVQARHEVAGCRRQSAEIYCHCCRRPAPARNKRSGADREN